jgi:hypothetical protein
MNNSSIRLQNNYRCYFCYIDEIGLCDTCLENYKNVCLNCITCSICNITYTSCKKCSRNGSQQDQLQNNKNEVAKDDINNLVKWIKQNDTYFLNLFPSS